MRVHERNSREYWVSCCADRMASIGAKAWRWSGGVANARVDGAGSCRGQRIEQALAGALAQRHRLDRRLHHVLGPAEREGDQAVVHGRAARARRPARTPPATSAPASALAAWSMRRARRCALAQPLEQRAAHLLGLQLQLAGLADRVAHVFSALTWPKSLARQASWAARHDGQVAARDAQVQLIEQPGAGLTRRRSRGRGRRRPRAPRCS